MGFVYEDLPEEEWEELKEKYQLNEWGGRVKHLLRNRESNMLIINQGGQNREEHPSEYAIVYNNEVSFFDKYETSDVNNKHTIKIHISNLNIPLKLKECQAYLKDSIESAFIADNDAYNTRYLKRYPNAKTYSVEFVFEGEE